MFKALIFVASLFMCGIIFWCAFLNHVSINEIGIAYDSVDGSVVKQQTAGWYMTHPLVLVTYVRTVPFKVEIPSTAKVIVARMVAFNPDGLDEYIRLQGWSYNLDSDLPNIMLGYAFSGTQYSFLTVVQTAGGEETNTLRPLGSTTQNGEK